jgi:hypothetical protein
MKNLRLKTNNKSTGEAQPANCLKSLKEMTPCRMPISVNAKEENDELKSYYFYVNKANLKTTVDDKLPNERLSVKSVKER